MVVVGGGKRVPLLICAVGAEEAEETMNMWECRFAFFVCLKCCYVHNFDRFFFFFVLSYRIVSCVYFATTIINKEMLSHRELKAKSAESHHEKAILCNDRFFVVAVLVFTVP